MSVPLGVGIPVTVTLLPHASTPPWIVSFGLAFPILTSIFITSISVVVAYVSFKAYLHEGLPSVLYLGCGTLVFGCTSLMASVLLGREGINISGTTFAMGAALSAAFHLACALSTQSGGAPKPGNRYLASLWIPVAFLCVVSVGAATLTGILPPFYEVAKGTTTLGQAVLGVAAVSFAISSVVISNPISPSASTVLHRYSMALGATAAGVAGVILSDGDVQALSMRLGWAALYIGGLLLLTSVLSAEKADGLPASGKGQGLSWARPRSKK